MAYKRKKAGAAQVRWAEDVLWAYEHLGQEVNDKTPGASPQRLNLHARAQDVAFEKELHKNLLPKASDILAQHGANEDETAIVKEEKKGIAELQEILETAIQESKIDGAGEI